MRFATIASVFFLACGLAACGEDKPAERQTAAAPEADASPTAVDSQITDETAPETGSAASVPHPRTEPGISAADLSARVKALADDRFEGRGPGTPAGEAAADWIAAELARLDVKPGNGESYFQDVPAVAITMDPAQSWFEIAGPDGATKLAFGDDAVWWTKRAVNDEERVTESALVFVGYGVVAPEENWNDYEGVDVKGKTVVMFINDPGFITHDDSLFKGKAMTYYGRWTYKYEEAARQGAAAVIIVHETEPAAYGWNVVRTSWAGTQLDLERENKNADRVAIESWITADQASALFARAGMDYEAAKLAANARGFKPVAMPGLKLNAVVRSTVSSLTTRNVVGIVPGLGKPDEYFLYTGHWDHLGLKPGVPGDDKIHNGAVDNSTGVAAVLEIAELFAQARTERSVMFAFVTLEEQGLLGSVYFAEHPVVPLKQIVAGVNIDGMLPKSPSRDMTVVGSGASELEDILADVLKAQDRRTSPDPESEKGYFYRSDHISLAKVGVPMIYASGGQDLVEGGIEAGKAVSDDYRVNRYHQPSDEWSASWDLSGPVRDIEALHEIGRRVADSDQWPNWYAGNEFRAVRDASRAQ